MTPFLRETFPVGLLGCNCTLLGDPRSGEALVIDPGLSAGAGDPGSPESILRRLGELGFRLTEIIVTHAHIDHVGGALRLKQLSGAPVVMHQADLPLLAMMDLQARWLGVAPPPIALPDQDASDGLSIGTAYMRGEVLYTPGHTEGSICLHFSEQRLLLAGDTLFQNSIGRTDLPGGDGSKILRSIESRLLPLPEWTRIIPGHGPETTLAAERERNPFLRGMRS